MITPVFPYKNNQIILSSDRIILNSKSDAIFLFGGAAVGLSSTQTVNLDAKEKIVLEAPKIELGSESSVIGQPVVLGKSLSAQLSVLMQNLSNAGVLLSQVSETNVGASMQYIASAGQIINKEANRLLGVLNQAESSILSKKTYTS